MAQFRKRLFTNQLKENLTMFLTSKLLDSGYYRNIVANNAADYNANDLSKLLIDTRDSSYASGVVWAAPRPNWVFEGDVSVPVGASVPIVPSGVFVEGVFKLPNDTTYGHVFDYIGGRVIFTSGAAPEASTSIQASYSYKEFTVKLPDNQTVNNLYEAFMSNTDLPTQTFPMMDVYTPTINIVVTDHKPSPLALGGGIILRKNVQIYLVANDDWKDVISDMADLITYQFDVVANMVDIDLIPERINFRGQKATTYADYKTLAADQTYFYNKFEFLQLEYYFLPSMREGYNRIRVDCLIEMRGAPQ